MGANIYFFDKRVLAHFDYLLIIYILPLIVISHNLISELSSTLANKQLIHFLIAFLFFIVFFLIPVRKLVRFIPVFYWIGIFFLFAVEFWGVTKLGATRWINIPFLSITFQPSESFKPIFILMIAYLIQNKQPLKNGYNFKEFCYFSFYIFLPFILIAKEPDLGTALILLLIGYGILFIIGVNWKIWTTILIFIGLSSPLIYANFIKDYQKKRINDFLSKEPSYQVKQSIIAIGNGGLFGEKVEKATQTQLKFLPIATSDFIFAYFAERHGFIGVIGLLFIYTLLIYHILSLNYYFLDDFLIRSFASGLGLLIFLNMSVNILMVIGYAPVVGLPLPFFSYGGSSLISFIVAFAILENLIAFRFRFMYSFERKL